MQQRERREANFLKSKGLLQINVKEKKITQ
jgi:hypothetical protein